MKNVNLKEIWEKKKDGYINFIKFLLAKSIVNKNNKILILSKNLDFTFVVDGEIVWLNFENEISIELNKLSIDSKSIKIDGNDYFEISIKKELTKKFLDEFLTSII